MSRPPAAPHRHRRHLPRLCSPPARIRRGADPPARAHTARVLRDERRSESNAQAVAGRRCPLVELDERRSRRGDLEQHGHESQQRRRRARGPHRPRLVPRVAAGGPVARARDRAGDHLAVRAVGAARVALVRSKRRRSGLAVRFARAAAAAERRAGPRRAGRKGRGDPAEDAGGADARDPRRAEQGRDAWREKGRMNGVKQATRVSRCAVGSRDCTSSDTG